MIKKTVVAIATVAAMAGLGVQVAGAQRASELSPENRWVFHPP